MPQTPTSAQDDCRTVPPPRRGTYRRLFAWILSRLQDHYGEAIDQRKRDLLGGLQGDIVEIGAGAGVNLALYGHEANLLLVEPNAHLHEYLRAAGDRLGVDFELRGGTAERMDVATDSADAVVCTLVLCSVDDMDATLREVRRVLRPGGRFIFVEHVAAPSGSSVRRWQRRLRSFWRRIGDGCTLDRETWKAIEAAGFADVRTERFQSEGPPFVRPHICGTARN